MRAAAACKISLPRPSATTSGPAFDIKAVACAGTVLHDRHSDVLDIERIRFGLSNRHNPTLASHTVHILPYRGLGTGTPRTINAWPMITLNEDRQSNQFSALLNTLLKKGLIWDQVGAKSGLSRD